MLKEVERIARDFLEESSKKPVRVISHYDTDGITSAAILVKTLKRLDRKFTLRIVKGLDEEILKEELSRNKREVLIFSDLGSGSLDYFSNLEEPIFILDHHEIDKSKLNDKIKIVNPHLSEDPEANSCTGSGLCYLFAVSISEQNRDLSKIAMVGIVGDRHEAELSKVNQSIVNDTHDLTIRKGVVLYPATRPLKKTLEYSTSPYIPGVTGNPSGALEILREARIDAEKSLLDLDEEEMSRLITAIMVRKAIEGSEENILGNLYVLKFFNRKEDAREISVMINACSRLGRSDVALAYCLEDERAKSLAFELYARYKQELIYGLRLAEKVEKISGDGFVIINTKDKVRDTIIGTICSMISSSRIYKEGTVLIGMAYRDDKIKVSARIVGREGRNLKEFLEQAVIDLKEEHPGTYVEIGGHEFAAGCLIEREKERPFIDALKKNFQIEFVRV
ncbi:DHH family phosphoesterase [Candidatus Pacearchaeota archaeon]|nr:MAG: DHH family phosphoesterase [Candidatus Pacearchaeota archaeon]